MKLDLDDIQKYIPQYLASEDQRKLVDELRSISSGGHASYILSKYNDHFQEEMLQGDGWHGFRAFMFHSGEKRSVKGLVLSNSCDVDPANPRDVPSKVTFAPLVKLSAFERVLAASGIDNQRILKKIDAIKSQKTTNIFYIPSSGTLAEDHIVRLDEVYTMPVADHFKCEDRGKIFTLSNTGFYMFVFKLSVHFCRLQEKVIRGFS
jgi:hypothetical protein